MLFPLLQGLQATNCSVCPGVRFLNSLSPILSGLAGRSPRSWFGKPQTSPRVNATRVDLLLPSVTRVLKPSPCCPGCVGGGDSKPSQNLSEVQATHLITSFEPGKKDQAKKFKDRGGVWVLIPAPGRCLPALGLGFSLVK